MARLKLLRAVALTGKYLPATIHKETIAIFKDDGFESAGTPCNGSQSTIENGFPTWAGDNKDLLKPVVANGFAAKKAAPWRMLLKLSGREGTDSKLRQLSDGAADLAAAGII